MLSILFAIFLKGVTDKTPILGNLENKNKLFWYLKEKAVPCVTSVTLYFA